MSETKSAAKRNEALKGLPEQANYLLASGNGTVAPQDYDPVKHGRIVEETPEQYEARITGQVVDPSAVPFRVTAGNPVAPGATTIAGLHTFDPQSVPAPPAPIRRPSAIGAPPLGLPVAVSKAVEPKAGAPVKSNGKPSEEKREMLPVTEAGHAPLPAPAPGTPEAIAAAQGQQGQPVAAGSSAGQAQTGIGAAKK